MYVRYIYIYTEDRWRRIKRKKCLLIVVQRNNNQTRKKKEYSNKCYGWIWLLYVIKWGVALPVYVNSRIVVAFEITSASMWTLTWEIEPKHRFIMKWELLLCLAWTCVCRSLVIGMSYVACLVWYTLIACVHIASESTSRPGHNAYWHLRFVFALPPPPLCQCKRKCQKMHWNLMKRKVSNIKKPSFLNISQVYTYPSIHPFMIHSN